MAILTTGIGSLSLSVTGCTGNGVSPIVLTVAAVPSSVAIGQRITVASVGGNTNANGDKTITNVSGTTITFAGTGNGAYTSGGTVTRKYASIGAWETATDGALGSDIKEGEMYADSVFDYGSPAALVIDGATGTSATTYRRLKAWSGHRYNAFTDTGVKIRKAVDSAYPYVIRIDDPYTQIVGIGLEMTDGSPTSGRVYGVFTQFSGYVRVDGCTVICTTIDNSTVVPEGFSLASAGEYFNCIAIGSGASGTGLKYGINFGTLSGTAYNCVAYQVAGDGDGIGFRSVSTTVVVANCIAVESGSADFSLSSYAQVYSCISSDSSVEGKAGSSANVLASAVFRNAGFRDFRQIIGSLAIDRGVDGSALFTTDIEGTTRVSPWEIGAFNGYVAADTAAPTVVTESIGATGRDYATIAAWIAATSLHLVSRNEIRRGVLYDDGDFTESITLEGATTDAKRYRELVPADGHGYDPVNDVGVSILDSVNGNAFQLNEDYFRISRVRLENTYSGTTAGGGGLAITGDGVRVDGCTIIQNAYTGTGANYCLQSSGLDVRVRNCIAAGGTTTTGATAGFYVGGAGSKVQNCAALRIRNSTGGTCYVDLGAGGVLFENCIAGSSDVGFDVTVGWQRYNASVDTTADGLNSIVSITAADVWVESASNDLRLLANSVANNAGVNLSVEFSTDITGATRTGLWEIGPYGGYLAPPEWPRVPSKQTHRLVPIWTIERRDGYTLYFAGHPSELVHGGLTYEPGGGLDATAHRREASLRDHSLEAAGIISSDKITFDDLDAGLYSGARVTLSLIDWKYPWAAPAQRSVFVLRRISFDGERWNAELEGVTSLLKRVTGRVYGPACPYKFGSANPDAAGRAGCGIDVNLWTTSNVAVTSVADSRLEFAASALSAGFADDYFSFGWLTWTTGANTGLTHEISDYVQSTRTFTLNVETPYAIEVGDDFNVVAGDDHSFETCRVKFSNAINFGGDPYTPGTNKAIQTPTQ